MSARLDETWRVTSPVPAELSSAELTPADLPDLQCLARACLDRDGGLPMFADEAMLSSRMLRDRAIGLCLPDGCDGIEGPDGLDGTGGTLVAAAGISLGGDEAVTTGMVHPAMRRRGIGDRLLRWAIALPNGVQVAPMSDVAEQDLFDAYRHSFADRPGFVEPDAEEWLAELREDDEWRRDLSLLIRDERGVPIAFVNMLGTWLDQVGVVPAWRGHGLGAYLVAESLRSLQAEGAEETWLCVNVNNPAEELYRQLGFVSYGTRARYYKRPAACA